MSVSKIEIINLALSEIGESGIMSLTDRSRRAAIATQNYDVIRRSLIRKFEFNFSIKRKLLAPLVEKPEFDFTTQYLLPNDFIKVAETNTLFKHKIEGRRLFSNLAEPFPLVYVADIEDPAMFDSIFVELFALTLAEIIVEPLTQSNTKKQLIREKLISLNLDAGINDGIENSSLELTDTPWVTGRN